MRGLPTGPGAVRHRLRRLTVVAATSAALLAAPAASAASGDISTVAGGGAADGGPAVAASINTPAGVAVDAAGSLYIADLNNHRVRKVAPSGTITTVAGNGTAGSSGDGGPATSAQLDLPTGVAVDAEGNVYIADIGGNRVRKVDQSGTITTVAGNGTGGYAGDGGVATSAKLYSPYGVAVDGAGSLYIADTNNDRVRKMDQSGIINTVAGNGTNGFSGDGGRATTAQLNRPYGVAVDVNVDAVGGAKVSATGSLYIADSGNGRVRKVALDLVVTTVAGNGSSAYSGDGGSATAAGLTPAGVAVGRNGGIDIADANHHRVRQVMFDLFIATVAGNGTPSYSGDGGPATNAALSYPSAVAVDATGSLFIADYGNFRVRKVSPLGIITTVAGTGRLGYSGDGGKATSAEIGIVFGLAVDAGGNVYIGDSGNGRVRKVDQSGIITTVAGNGTQGSAGDGGPATSASFFSIEGVAVDGGGSIYIVDHSGLRVRRVSPSGIITTVAGNGQYGYSGDGGPATSATFKYPEQVVVDDTGTLYITEPFGQRVRKVSPSGIITTVAGTGVEGYSGDGSLATSASFRSPRGVAVGGGGDLYIGDSGNNRIRKVSPAGIVSTFAGNGISGFAGDGGPAASAQFNALRGLVVDRTGNLYIADANNNRVRKISA